MRRTELFEIHDHPWFPAFRDLVTDALQVLWGFSNSYKPILPLLQNALASACAETLFGSLKVERLHGQHFETVRQAKDEVPDWLLWYNRTRLHSTLHHLSPMQLEQDWNRRTAAIAS